jgi:hypothetical protein
MIATSIKRLKICSSCEHYKNFRCGVCGCIMPFKVLLKHSHCPIIKWL